MKSDIHKPNDRSKVPTKSLNFPHTLGKVQGVAKDVTDKVLGVEHIVKCRVRDYNKTHETPYDPTEKYKSTEGC